MTNCSNNYGPRQFPEKLIPLMILNALEGKPLPVYGDGLNVRDWIHVEDHARGLMPVLERGRVGETYLFGGRAVRTNLEVVEALCAACDAVRPAGAAARQAHHLRGRPARPRPALRHRPEQGGARTRLGAGPGFRGALPRRCAGTSTTRPGGSPSRRAATAASASAWGRRSGAAQAKAG